MKKELISKAQKEELLKEFSEILAEYKLSQEDSLFVLYFLETNHAGKAYKLAYNKSEFMPYNYVNIYANAKLKRKNISEAIVAMKKAQQYTYNIDANKYVEFLMRVANADLGDYVTFGTEEVPVTNQYGNVVDEETGEEVTRKRSFLELENSYGLDTSLISKIKAGKDGVAVELHDKKWAWDRLKEYYNWVAVKETDAKTVNNFLEAIKGTVQNTWKDELEQEKELDNGNEEEE